MSDVEGVLDAINQLVAPVCGYCSAPLSTVGVLDFCGPDCQAAWSADAAWVEELVGYREPCELVLPGVTRGDLAVFEQVAARDAARGVGVRAWDVKLLAEEKPACSGLAGVAEVIEKGEQT